MQRFELENEKIAFYLGLLHIQLQQRGEPATTGEEFQGFTQVVEGYRTFSGRLQGPVRKMYLTREGEGLKIRVESQPHFRCHYHQPKSPLFFWKLATPLGDTCEPATGDWAFLGEIDRVETVVNKERIIPKCVDVAK